MFSLALCAIREFDLRNEFDISTLSVNIKGWEEQQFHLFWALCWPKNLYLHIYLYLNLYVYQYLYFISQYPRLGKATISFVLLTKEVALADTAITFCSFVLKYLLLTIQLTQFAQKLSCYFGFQNRDKRWLSELVWGPFVKMIKKYNTAKTLRFFLLL